MNVLFLDHDGVICHGDEWGTRFTKQDNEFTLNHEDVNLRFDNFNKKSIDILNEIINATDCEIVISSDWKQFATLEEMGNYYINQGIIKKPIDFTPTRARKLTESLASVRVREISSWMSSNTNLVDVDCYVAVDDMNLYDLGDSHFVWCSPLNDFGINADGIFDKIIKRFNKNG